MSELSCSDRILSWEEHWKLRSAPVMKLVNIVDLKSTAERLVGSNPTGGMLKNRMGSNPITRIVNKATKEAVT